MRSLSITALLVALSLGMAAPGFADVQLSIRDGQISIVATNATVGQILAEWARVGQTTIVNLERIPREPVTIELTNVSERAALEVVLRTASGYVAAPRRVMDPNASRFDRIVIMPPSVVTASTAAAATSARHPSAPATSNGPAYPQPDPVVPVQATSEDQPPPAPDSGYSGVAAGAAENDEPPAITLDVSGASPIPDQRAQIANRRRQALETVDPRSFKLPAQPEGGLFGVPAATPARAAVPGTIVQPPPRPGTPR